MQLIKQALFYLALASIAACYTDSSSGSDSGSDSDSDISANPQIVVKLQTPWMREYLAFTHQTPVMAKAQGPLRTDIKNYQEALSDTSDLRAWTRYIVESDNTDYGVLAQGSRLREPMHIDVDQFIRYLVEKKGFKRKDLDFLQDADLDYGNDQIEKELSKIRESQRSSQNINIGGERGTIEVSGAAKVSTCLALLAIVALV